MREGQSVYPQISEANGGEALASRIYAIEDAIKKLRADIVQRPLRGVADLRARVLIVLHEMRPTSIRHEGRLDFPGDGDALFDAAAS